MDTEVNEMRESARQVMDGSGIAAAEDASWTQIAELGWLMVTVPEELGGLGMGVEAACALQIEMGRGLATVPYLPAMLAIEALCGSEHPERDDWLEQLMSGASLFSASLADSTLRIVRSGDALEVSGLLEAVPSADRASHVLAIGADGDSVALVSLEDAHSSHIATWDVTRRLFDVKFNAVKVDASALVASGEAARNLIARLAVFRDLSLAADAVGGAAALFEMTVEYLLTRQQYGRPLALFQALKHRCADLKVKTEAAEALLLANLSALAGANGNAAALGKAAKELACSTYAFVAEEALQLHGGIGMTEEHVCHLFLKRAMLDEHLGADCDSYALDLAAGLLDATA